LEVVFRVMRMFEFWLGTSATLEPLVIFIAAVIVGVGDDHPGGPEMTGPVTVTGPEKSGNAATVAVKAKVEPGFIVCVLPDAGGRRRKSESKFLSFAFRSKTLPMVVQQTWPFV
jgi:hypothetical protein